MWNVDNRILKGYVKKTVHNRYNYIHITDRPTDDKIENFEHILFELLWI